MRAFWSRRLRRRPPVFAPLAAPPAPAVPVALRGLLSRCVRTFGQRCVRRATLVWAGGGDWSRRLRRSPAAISGQWRRLRGRRLWPRVPAGLSSPLGRSVLRLSGVTMFVGATWGITASSFLEVEEFRVTGAFQLPAEVVVAATGITRGTSLTDVDTSDAEAAVVGLPWVLEARVERAFPNRIEIGIAERTVAAFAARPAGGFALLDRTGRVLAYRSARPQFVPEVTGLPAIPEPGRWQGAAVVPLEVVGAFPDPLRNEVVSVGVEGGGVTVEVAGRIVAFGPAERLPQKVAALQALLERLGDRPVDRIDVSVPSAPVVDPIGEPPPPAPAPTAPRD